ncbi:receptor-like protein EIX2 [Nicotiana sylvestris]|uniref:receptor-like protein EIX2 n=1 Tax=Nicotiana sylvestris TaxID=4096 RepID=UPI00388C3FB7
MANLMVLAITFCFFLFYILTNTKLSICTGICRENEQQALENLKKEVFDPTNLPPSWIVGEDCCEGEGVMCHNLTRHVIELHIRNGLYVYLPRYDLRINNFDWLPSLSNLENLEMVDVDLSNVTNWLQVSTMLPSLVDLSLVNCSPHHIPPLLLHNFSSLETLNLSCNNFSSSIHKWIFNLPSLVSLGLSVSNLIGPFPEGPVNFTSLRSFRAGFNHFNCSLPRWLVDLNNLETLKLRYSGIEGAMPREVGNVTKLRILDLSYNNLNSTIPNWIYRCQDLVSLSLGESNIEGVVSNAISNLSSIIGIELFGNMLSGKLPGKLSKLQWLNLSGNLFKGEVFELFNSSSFLWVLKLRNNSLTGTLPESLGQLPMLEEFDISNNRLEGVVTESHFTKLTQLTDFYASNNNLTLKMLNLSHNQFVGEVPTISTPYNWLMLLGSNNFSGPLPLVSRNVFEIDLSNNSFSGGLSHFLCETNKNYKFKFLNLEGNDLSGEIPDCWMNWRKLIVLNLGDIKLIGDIPKSMELLKIDLAENEFVRQLPPWLGMKFSDFIILSLSANRFYGELPPEICYFKDLQILDLANNSFFGTIPRCISNLTAIVSGNKLGEAYIEYFDHYYDSSEGNLGERAMVTTKGNIYQYDKILASVTSMDMSNNNLSRDILLSFTSLVGLRFCNFSKNHLTGRIPNGIGNMKVLKSLDLSENQLSGQIPQSLSSLSTLSFLNLFYNNLSRKILVSTQFQSFNSSSFQGNDLCGPPLFANCNSGGQIPDVDTEKDESDCWILFNSKRRVNGKWWERNGGK